MQISKSITKKNDEQLSLLVLKILCHTLTDYRTILDDFYKVVEIVEWLRKTTLTKLNIIQQLGLYTQDSNVRRSREVTEKGSDVQTTAGCGDGLSAYAVLA